MEEHRLALVGQAADGPVRDLLPVLVEVVALGHGVRLGLATAGLRRPRLLHRLGHLTLVLGSEIAMQMDGEAFIAPAGRYQVTHAGSIKALDGER